MSSVSALGEMAIHRLWYAKTLLSGKLTGRHWSFSSVRRRRLDRGHATCKSCSPVGFDLLIRDLESQKLRRTRIPEGHYDVEMLLAVTRRLLP